MDARMDAPVHPFENESEAETDKTQNPKLLLFLPHCRSWRKNVAEGRWNNADCLSRLFKGSVCARSLSKRADFSSSHPLISADFA